MRYARSPIRCLLSVGTCVALFYGRHIFSLLFFLVRQLRPPSIQFKLVLVVLFSLFSLVPSLFTLHIFIKIFLSRNCIIIAKHSFPSKASLMYQYFRCYG